jgi:hypothetical protein
MLISRIFNNNKYQISYGFTGKFIGKVHTILCGSYLFCKRLQQLICTIFQWNIVEHKRENIFLNKESSWRGLDSQNVYRMGTKYDGIVVCTSSMNFPVKPYEIWYLLLLNIREISIWRRVWCLFNNEIQFWLLISRTSAIQLQLRLNTLAFVILG